MWPFKPRPTPSSARSPVRASSAPSVPLLPVRQSVPYGPCPPVRSTVRALSAPICLIVRALSAPSTRPLDHLVSAHPPVRSLHASSATSARTHPPRPLRPCETAAVIYTPPRLPSNHPTPRSLRWALSLCCAFNECGTARSSRTLGGWSELRGKPLQFFFAHRAVWRGRPFTSRETELQQQLRVQD